MTSDHVTKRRIAAIAIGAALAGDTAAAQLRIDEAETMAGAWEMASSSIVDGFVLPIVSFVETSSSRVVAQHASIRVFHRDGGGERWGWYSVPPDSLTSSGARLRIEGTATGSSFALSVSWEPEAHRWVGTLQQDGRERAAVFERPAGSGCALCGHWTNVGADTTSRLHILRSADGVVSAWRDLRSMRSMDIPVTSVAGERLAVMSVTDDEIVLTTESAICCTFEFAARLSGDRQQLIVSTAGGKPGTILPGAVVFTRD